MFGPILMFGGSRSTLYNGLRGFWNLDGNATEALGNAGTGTLVGSGSWTTGLIGQSYQSAALSYINLAEKNATLRPTTAITLSAWFYFTAAQGANLRAISDWHQNGSLDRWILGYSPDGSTIIFHAFGVNDSFGSIGTTIPTNTWVNLTGTWSQASGQKIAYRNGVAVSTTPGLVGSLASDTLFPASGFPICLGGQFNTGPSVTGRIDLFGIWDRALSPAEVTELNNAGAGKAYPF